MTTSKNELLNDLKKPIMLNYYFPPKMIRESPNTKLSEKIPEILMFLN